MLDSLTNVIKRLQEISEVNQNNVEEEITSTQEENNPIEAYRKALNNAKSNSYSNNHKTKNQSLEEASKKVADITSVLNPDIKNILAQQAIIAITKDILNNNYKVKNSTYNNKAVTTIILSGIPVLEYTDTEGKLISINIDLAPKDYELVKVALEKMKYVSRKIDKALDVRNLKN